MLEREVNVLKRAICLLLLTCLVAMPLTTFAESAFPFGFVVVDCPYGMLTVTNTPDEANNERELPSRLEGMDIYGRIPMRLTSSSNPQYQNVNHRVDEVIDLLIADARRVRAREITFSYSVYTTDNMVSVMIQAYVSSVISRNLVRSVNFHPQTGEFLTLRDFSDHDILPLAGRILTDRMRRSPENYYAAASISLENQAFYATDRGITILFDEFQLSAMVSGIISLNVPLDSIGITSVSQSNIHTSGAGYNLMMVPLRYVAEGLGYYVRWNSSEDRAEVLTASPQSGGRLLAWLTPNVNDYHTMYIQRSLESAPLLLNEGILYVPITFFEQILPLSVYNIGVDGNITFMAYLR